MKLLPRKRWSVIQYDHKTQTYTTVARCWTWYGADDLAWRLAAAHYRESFELSQTRFSWSAEPVDQPTPPAPAPSANYTARHRTRRTVRPKRWHGDPAPFKADGL